MYSDTFLAKLGAWQNGWREDKARRISVTAELIDAVRSLIVALPVTDPPPFCYRKRFLVPHNPQNGGDLASLVLNGYLEEGVASWTSDPEFGRNFKELVRAGSITAIFGHQPAPSEVVVDFGALWNDLEFREAVTNYADRNGEFATALTRMGNVQSELILSSPLLSSEVVDFVGLVGDFEQLVNEAGAVTEEQENSLWQALVDANIFPGDARWSGKAAAQRALKKAKTRFWKKVEALERAALFRGLLLGSTAATKPPMF